MKNRRYVLFFAGAIVWIVIAWIPFYVAHLYALFFAAVYCTVTACLLPVFIAVEIGNRRRKVEQQRTEERSRQVALAVQRAQMDAQNKLETQRYIEANRSWRLKKARKLETSGSYEEAAKMYDKLEMPEKAGECRRMAKTSS
jgi:ABC-type protease/lipase transport system fused ATPase/permease subunit